MNDFWSLKPAPTPEEVDPRKEAGVKTLANMRGIDWNNLSHEEINELGRSVNLLADDPRHLWAIFRFYTRMLRAGKTYEAVGLTREGNVRLRLRESWLALHCTDVDEPEVYRAVEGEDGYQTYIEYANKLKDELSNIEYYEDVVRGAVSENSPHSEVVTAIFKEYIPGANW